MSISRRPTIGRANLSLRWSALADSSGSSVCCRNLAACGNGILSVAVSLFFLRPWNYYVCGILSDRLRLLGMQVRAEATLADRLDRRIAAFGFQQPHDAMDMILDGELGEIQVRGNFLVREAPGEK